jgi:predicted RNA polymerase sigma factor
MGFSALQRRARGCGVSLRSQAIRLTRALVELMPNEPEAAAAALLLGESRAAARGPGAPSCSCATKTGRCGTAR